VYAVLGAHDGYDNRESQYIAEGQQTTKKNPSAKLYDRKDYQDSISCLHRLETMRCKTKRFLGHETQFKKAQLPYLLLAIV
jgi:hypothetical protein